MTSQISRGRSFLSALYRPQAQSLAERRARMAWLMVAPALLLLFTVAAWPLFKTIVYSFTDATLTTTGALHFVGLANYLDLSGDTAFGVLADSLWWQAVTNTLWFTLVTVTLELIFGLAIALLLNQKFVGRGILRTAILVPWAIPTIVSAKMWGWMFHDQYGLINDLLSRIGIISEPLAWVAVPELSMWAVIIAEVWKTTPFMVLMLLAAMQVVSEDLYEVARLEGASAWQRFRYVTMPLIWPAMVVALIFRSLDALRVFDLIYVLTSNSESTMSISGYARQVLVDYQDMGGGSAASVLVFMLVAGVAICYLLFGKVRLNDSGEVNG
ncbi:carbohydrate ABC transporter permease [Gynuella sunshinyii]|uniref:ABC-type sugar transport system, permease component n=1 Tax=Gynuella sunshinyii YC6258 TaxID=1445510 RepID=A0A0C5VK46_9GAMM|nr:sugar ABC transporter permease [Gynuella sunshinyii]AJQ95057.1 ABC-type sugar transport system, permease component [Gynuella sunshinyii YC6258]